MIQTLLLFAFGFLLLFFAIAYWRERQYRLKPYYKKTVRNWAKNSLPAEKPLYKVALIGDCGAIATDGSDAVMALLQHWLATAGKNSYVIFLGDNIYPKGLPPRFDKHREKAEKIIQAQLEAVKNHPGLVTFLGGNHDWNKGRPDGYEYALRQEQYILSVLNQGSVCLPPNGCPGPVAIPLTDDLLLVVINTQWWVQRGKKPMGKAYGCDIENPGDFFIKLEHILNQHKEKRILIAAHHPLYSNALHGGKFTVKQHLFPLTAAHKKFYMPLPGAGSLYPLYRKWFGADEDMSHPRYRKLRRKLLYIFSKHQNIIYAAGHDHNLQYFNLKHNHYIVSGSGSKTSFVKKGGKATFTHEHKGFFVIEYYKDQTWLRVLEPGNNHEEIEIFRKRL